MLQVTTNVEPYRPKCTWSMFEYLQFLYITSYKILLYLRRNRINGSHGATPNHWVKLRRPLFCHNLWNCSDYFRIPLSISVIVLNFLGMPCTFNICGMWYDPKERIQTSQSMSLMRLCVWTTCTPSCTVRIIFVFWGNSLGPVGIIRGRCLEKLDDVISILLGTDDTTQLLWSLKPHDIFNYKFTAWKVHYTFYDLFIPLHIFWLPISFVSIRLYKNVVSCILCHTRIVEHCLVMCSSANQR